MTRLSATPLRNTSLPAGFILTGLLLVLPACTSQTVGVPPSLEKRFIDHPAGSRIHYRDGETGHLITLLEDGTYQFESGSPYDSAPAIRRGHWSWRAEGTHKAELTLDANRWILTFASPDSAAAVNTSAAGNTFAFQFERL